MATKKAVTKKTQPKKAAPAKIAPKKDAAKSLDDLFEDCLKDALWAETAVKDALPKVIKNASSKYLKKVLTIHLAETKDQIKVLNQIFKIINVKPEAEKCDAMAGILKEVDGIMKETQPGAVRAAGIIAACQKIEHYEIASYGTMISFSKLLKHPTAKKLLDSILKEEKNADKTLSKLATTEINIKADKKK